MWVTEDVALKDSQMLDMTGLGRPPHLRWIFLQDCGVCSLDLAFDWRMMSYVAMLKFGGETQPPWHVLARLQVPYRGVRGL